MIVADVIEETSDSVTIVFDRPGSVSADYRPGQFLTVRVPSERTGSVARCYSLCSAPQLDDKLMVTVKRTEGGYASNWLCDNVRPGDTLDCLHPSGKFTPTNLDANLLLIGAGSGITPLLSIAKTALALGSGRITLFYANRDSESVIFRRQLADLVATAPDRLAVIHWIESIQGLPSSQTMQTLLTAYADFDAFICGPAPFMECARSSLRGLDVPRNRIHIEKFLSLSGDPFAASGSVVKPLDIEVPQGMIAEVTVRLGSNKYVVLWPQHQTLIDVLIENSVDAPYSCREGECGSCQCTLLSGEVSMDTVGALDAEDIADGILLGCQARPVTDRIEIEF